jgi:hypothetical protein
MKGSYAKLNKVNNSITKKQNGGFHPLTCGNDSQKHSLLESKLEKNGNEYELTLFCKDCNWKQDVPKFFTNEVVLDDSF